MLRYYQDDNDVFNKNYSTYQIHKSQAETLLRYQRCTSYGIHITSADWWYSQPQQKWRGNYGISSTAISSHRMLNAISQNQFANPSFAISIWERSSNSTINWSKCSIATDLHQDESSKEQQAGTYTFHTRWRCNSFLKFKSTNTTRQSFTPSGSQGLSPLDPF